MPAGMLFCHAAEVLACPPLHDANCFAASQTPGSFNLSKVEEQLKSATSAR
jgi:hypothetical protein